VSHAFLYVEHISWKVNLISGFKFIHTKCFYSAKCDYYNNYGALMRWRNSAVCIATRYGLDDARFELHWGPNFTRPCRPFPRPTQFPVQWIPALFPYILWLSCRSVAVDCYYGGQTHFLDAPVYRDILNGFINYFHVSSERVVAYWTQLALSISIPTHLSR
jgi:hypothetical protein